MYFSYLVYLFRLSVAHYNNNRKVVTIVALCMIIRCCKFPPILRSSSLHMTYRACLHRPHRLELPMFVRTFRCVSQADILNGPGTVALTYGCWLLIHTRL